MEESSPRGTAAGPGQDLAPYNEDPWFRKAFSMTPLPMIIATAGDFCILDANDAFSRITGHGLDDIKGRRAAEARLMDAPTCQAIVKALIKSDGIKEIKVSVGLREGGFLGCLMSAEVVNVDGQRCAIAIFEDISRRDRLEAELKEAIECVMQDTSWFSSAVVEKLAQLRTPPNAPADQASLSDLTSREHEILGLICQGLTDPEICRFLNLSGNTVRNHLASIYSKLNVHRRAAVVVWARERGIYGYEKPRDGLRGSRR